MGYNKLQSLEANIAAIDTAFKVVGEKRKATEAERATLARYSGFGGIKEVLDMGTDNPVSPGMKKALQKLENVLSAIAQGNERFYKELTDSIKSSVLTAFYTPRFVIEAVAGQVQSALAANGLRMNSFLEPSAGIGGFLPVAVQGTHKVAFEKDLVTGLVLTALQDDTKP